MMSDIDWESNFDVAFGVFMGIMFFSEFQFILALIIFVSTICIGAIVDLLFASLFGVESQ